MAEDGEPLNELEELLGRVERGDASFEEFVQGLAAGRIFVLLSRPWDGTSPPPPDTEMLMVSDGDNHEQVMLAMFTDASRAREFKEQAPGFGIVGMPAMLAFLGVREGQGMMLNPNSELTVRFSPERTAVICSKAKEVLEQMKQEHAANQQGEEPPG